jgi:hypothetical protein
MQIDKLVLLDLLSSGQPDIASPNYGVPPMHSRDLIRKKIAQQSLKQKGYNLDRLPLVKVDAKLKLLDDEAFQLTELYQNLMRDRYIKVISRDKEAASDAMKLKVKKMIRDR